MVPQAPCCHGCVHWILPCVCIYKRQSVLPFDQGTLPAHCLEMLSLMKDPLVGEHDQTVYAVLCNHSQASLATRLADSRMIKILKPAVDKLLASSQRCCAVFL